MKIFVVCIIEGEKVQLKTGHCQNYVERVIDSANVILSPQIFLLCSTKHTNLGIIAVGWCNIEFPITDFVRHTTMTE